MKNKYQLVCTILLWSSLPLVAGLGYWEHQLVLSSNGHILVQILLVGLIYSWVWFWYAQKENDRLSHRPIQTIKQVHHPLQVNNLNYIKDETLPGPSEIDITIDPEIKEKIYVSNN